MKSRIAFVTGTTLGHIFPALNIAARISAKGGSGFGGKNNSSGVQIQFILSKNQKFLFFLHDFEKKFISAKPLYFKKNFFIRLFLFFKSFFEAGAILIKTKPNLIVSFGSYISFPVVVVGRFLNIPIIIHEQNLSVGITNKILFNLCNLFVVSFNETKKNLPVSEKIIYSGILTRPDLKIYSKEEAARFFGFTSNKFTILIMGGSQGSHKINMVFLESLKGLQGQDMQIIHLSGQTDYDWLNKEYQKYSFKIHLLKFLENMSLAYSASDLVIARSGAMTIAELAYFKKCSILIPYPWAGSHQIENARALRISGLFCRLIEEKSLSAIGLTQEIINVKNSHLESKDFSNKSFDFCASSNFIERIYTLVEK